MTHCTWYPIFAGILPDIVLLSWWATAAFYAYRAYGDATLLSHAIATWNHVTEL